MRLENVVCLVAGGASGLGLATVKRLIRNGAKVVAIDIQEDQGKKMAEEVGKDCMFVPADVRVHFIYDVVLQLNPLSNSCFAVEKRL